MTLKKLSIVVLAAGALAFGTFTAKAGARYDSPEKRVEHMKKELNLTDAQAAQIKTIFEKNEEAFKGDREAVKAAANDNAKKEAFEKMRADRDAVNAQIAPILNADQQTKWQQMMAKHEHDRDKDGEEAAPQQK